MILGLVADDKFADAEEYWRDHIAEVSDADALKIARACLARAEQLVEPADRKKAVFTAYSVAGHVQSFGKTDAVKAEGGQLTAERSAPSGRRSGTTRRRTDRGWW